MGNRITALVPVRHPSQGGYLVKPKPAASMLIQSLIESIEGLKNTLAVQASAQQPFRYVPSAAEQASWTEPEHVEVRQIQPSDPPAGQMTTKRSKLLDFFD